MSEQFHQSSTASSAASPLPRKKLTLLNSLIILAIIYLICEILPLFATLIARPAIPWIELGQWIIIIVWLIVGVRPPFLAWWKREKARRERDENSQG